jgi:hypothetical protein
MEFKQFDAQVKSALENIQMPFDPASWDALESRLDGMPAPDAIDQQLRPTLERLETAYDPASWNSLSAKMDGIARARRVKWTKAAEAALILLLLLNTKSLFQAIEPAPKVPVTPKATTNEPIAHRSRSKGLQKQETNNTSNISISDLSLAGQVFSIVHSLAQAISGSENEVLATDIQQIEIAEALPVQLDASLLAPAANAPLAYGMQRTIHPNRVSANLSIPAASRKGSSPFYTGFSAGYDQNFLAQEEHKDQSSGYNGTLVVGYRKGKWGFETGIQYSSKSYQPKRENVEYLNDPFQGIGFYYNNGVVADVVTLPAKVTRQVFKAGKTKAHAVAGVSGHFATSKQYQYNSVLYPPVQPLPPDPNNSPLKAVPVPPAKGILENGGMTHNAFVTADIGLRLEQSFGNRYSAFIEPIYRHSLGGGLGPVASRLNTVSVQAGVLATL